MIYFLLFFLAGVQSFSQTHSLLEIHPRNFQQYDQPIIFQDSININEIKFHEKEYDYTAIIGMSAIYLTTTISVYTYQRDAWWKDMRTNFHFMNDWDYALWIDKVGHFYDGILIQHGTSAAFEAANFDIEESMIYGTIGSFLFLTYVEIEDGFGGGWGFSPGDQIANTLGALFPLAQFYYPYLKNFLFRFSYYPDKLHTEGFIQGQQHIIFDDYEGQKFWLSFRMKEILPANFAKYWPPLLTLSLGTGVKNLDGHGDGRRDFYLALDLDFEEIPLHGRGWQFVKNTLNFLHFPMPGIRVNKDGTTFFALLF